MLDKSLLARILEEALKNGGDWAEIYVEFKENSSLVCEDSKIDKINIGREQGAGIRVLNGDKTAYVSTNRLFEKDLIEAARLAGRAAGSKISGDANLVLERTFAKPAPSALGLPEKISFEEKAEQILSANRIARQESRDIKQVTLSMADVFKQVQIANSDGEYIDDDMRRVRMGVNVIAARDGKMQTGFETAAATCGWELLREVAFEDKAARAARLALRMLDAEPSPVGNMPVVLAAEAGGTMVHEACGHGLEADLVQKGLSVYRKIGESVAAPGVSVIDDPTLKDRYGSYRFDDEGRPARQTILIKNGILNDYLYDRITSRNAGRSDSSNGRRESYEYKPIPRMSNTFIASGSDKPDEIIKSTQWGLLVKKMGGGQVNTTNGDFVFEVSEGYIIRDGEIGPAVRGATLTGNGPQVLQGIDRIGNDLGFSIGVCGKDGQGVPVADAQPTIRIKELVVGGTNTAKSRKRIRRI